nr:MAG TPA: hypothetical protein [Caudoviricetes sp.]
MSSARSERPLMRQLTLSRKHETTSRSKTDLKPYIP